MKTFPVLLVLALVDIRTALAVEHWPQFRGPDGQGKADARGLPLTWSEKENIKWKRAIHGRAWSSPVIWGKQIWVTTATEDGRQLFAVCVDVDSGRVVHDLKLFDVEKPQFAHKFNTYGSPTPAIKEGRVYVTFGSPGTACLDTRTGKVIWERRDFECNHFRGAGSSPVLFENLLLMNFDGSDHQFVVALDKQTGRTVWRVNRSIDFQDLGRDGKPDAEGDWRKAYSTPEIIRIDGVPVLVSSGAKAHYAYDPYTGKEYWRVEERSGHSAASRPVFGDGLLFFTTGFSKSQLLAVRPGKPGEHVVLDASKIPDAGQPVSGAQAGELQIAWKVKRNAPCKPSVLSVNGLVFMIDDGGIASCLDSKTGQEYWRERVGGNYSASPLYAEGRIYFFSEEGKTTIVAAGREYKVFAQNQLDEGFMASPAVAGKGLILRTKTHLYRIEQ